jgi:hypothetical protein
MLTEMVETLRPLRLPNNELFLRAVQWNQTLPHPFDDADLLAALRLVGSDGTGAKETFPEPILAKVMESTPNQRLQREEYESIQDQRPPNQRPARGEYDELEELEELEEFEEFERGAAQPHQRAPKKHNPKTPLQEEVVSTSLRLKEWIQLAYDRAGELTVERVWPSFTFHFVRWAKAHPDLRALDCEAGFRKVERIVKSWPREKREDPWQRWFDLDADDAEIEFKDLWDAIRSLPGCGPLELALDKARSCPLTLHANRTAQAYVTYVSLAAYLQMQVGDDLIFLPQEIVAKLMNLKQPTVSRLQRWSVEDGFLKVVRPAVANKIATRFRFDLSRFPELAKQTKEKS